MQRPESSGRYPARHQRALLGPAPDPRAAAPNPNLAGPNTPPQTVGPTSSTNAPGNFVMQASAWSGWPGPGTVDAGGTWTTPPLEDFGAGAGTIGPGGDWSGYGYGYGRQNPGGYMRRVSTVMTCVDLNSRQLASFPAYAVRNRKPESLPSWYSTGPEPELYPDWNAFMKAAVTSYYLAGETVLMATGRYRSNGYPARFIALNPHELFQDLEGTWYQGTDDNGVQLPRGDVLQVPYQRLPGVRHRRGVGPLQWAWGNVVAASLLERYAENIARYGVWAILKHPDELTKEQTDLLKAEWVSARSSAVGTPAVLTGSLEYETITMSPKDLALLDLLWAELDLICAAMGVPAVLVNVPTQNSMTYSSTLMLREFHWQATLRPAVRSFSGPMSEWLLPRGTIVEWNADDYIQPPLGERAHAYATLHSIEDDSGRVMTVDEIREAERFAPHTGTPRTDLDGVDGLVGAVRT